SRVLRDAPAAKHREAALAGRSQPSEEPMSPSRLKFTVAASLLAAGLIGGAAPLAHAEKGGCAQPVSSGSDPVATDCLFILRAAVGTTTCTNPCICEPRGTSP